MTIRYTRRLASCFGSLLMIVLLMPALAQDEPFTMQPEAGISTSRRRAGFFHRTKKDTPAAQLAWAAELGSEGKLRRAGRAYRNLVIAWHESPEAAKAQLAYANLLDARGKYMDAFEEYQYLIDHFAGHFPYDQVIAQQFKIANHVRTTLRGGFLLFKGSPHPERALPLYRQMIKNAPNWKRTPEAQYYAGLILEQEGDFNDAITAYEKVVFRYPKSGFADNAAFRRVKCLYEIADRNRRDEERQRTALQGVLRYLNLFPGGGDVAEAEVLRDVLIERLARMSFKKAMYYDRIAKRPESAIIAYTDFVNRFPTTQSAGIARQRIAELEAALGEQNED